MVIATILASNVVACASSHDEQQSEYSACLTATRAALIAEVQQPAEETNLVELPAGEVESAMRERLKAEARTQLLQQRISRLTSVRCESKRPTARSSAMESASAPASNAASAGGTTTSAGATQVSGTNNQVAGVDEADFVKNDNKHIFIVNESTFRIVEAWPAETMHEVGRVGLKGKAKKLFVHGDRAVVYSSDGQSSTSSGSRYSTGECTYGYDCENLGDGMPTTISVFDISNRAQPTLLRELRTSGSLIAARRVGNMIHTVVSQGTPGNNRYTPGTYLTGSLRTEAEVERAYATAVGAVEREIDQRVFDTSMPTFLSAQGGVNARRLWKSASGVGAAFTSVLSLDLGSQDASMISILGKPGVVHASGEAIYLASSASASYAWYGYGASTAAQTRSAIHKFGIGDSPSATVYRASGSVKGRALNQFALDEKDGRLRIATTAGRVPSPDVESTLSVLEEHGPALDVVGVVDGIAKTEDIRSVRFDGDRAYIVTFKKTDPLFAFDLADPRAPRMLGELKIPGFSTYMQMMDDHHLLTIGYDAADKGGFAYFTGVLLQIFDVSDPTQLRLAHKEIIGTRGSSSEALTNHLAFTYFAPKNLLALPMTVCEGGDENGGYGSTMSFSGLMVFDVTSQNGFSMLGKVAHPSSSASQYGGASNCSNWWTNASSEVRRSIVMDDTVFSVSDSRIKANKLGALSADVAEVPLRDEP